MEHSDLGGRGKYRHDQIDEHLGDLDKHIPLHDEHNYLTAEVTMTSADTFYDAVSIPLSAGTWYVTGVITVRSTNGATQHVTAKLYDSGGANYCAPCKPVLAGGVTALPVCGMVSLGTTTTVAMAAASTGTGGYVCDTSPYNGVTDRATSLIAVRIE